MVLISQARDVHLELIAERIREKNKWDVLVITEDYFKVSERFQYKISNDIGPKRLDWDLIWYRRHPKFKNILPAGLNEAEKRISLAQYDALFANWMSVFCERSIIDSPSNIRRANVKATQLSAASEAGFTIPATLITGNREEIEKFYKCYQKRIVVKALKTVPDFPIATRIFDDNDIEQLEKEEHILPAIYQERIDAKHHLRVNVFGKNISVFRIYSSELDWRFSPETSHVDRIEVSKVLLEKCQSVMRKIGLNMGTIDIIVDRFDRDIFLEINPQGQFLFLEVGNNGDELIDEFLFFIECEIDRKN